jgi:hypothetical protein
LRSRLRSLISALAGARIAAPTSRAAKRQWLGNREARRAASTAMRRDDAEEGSWEHRALPHDDDEQRHPLLALDVAQTTTD